MIKIGLKSASFGNNYFIETETILGKRRFFKGIDNNAEQATKVNQIMIHKLMQNQI
jgi:hypothetical protein